MQLRAQVQWQALWHLRLQHRLVLREDGVLEGLQLLVGRIEIGRNHSRLRTGVMGQMNSAMDSRQPSTAVVPASGTLVSTAA